MNASGFHAWSRTDIENIINALNVSNSDVVSAFDTYEMKFYRQGYYAAIRAFALSFGIEVIPTIQSKGMLTIESSWESPSKSLP